MREAPWLDVAVGELVRGVAEIPGVGHNVRILEYHQATSLRAADDETPWCSSFVNWCLRQKWIRGTNSARARSFEEWGRPIGPTPGAIAVLWRGLPGGATGHVGFYLGETAQSVILLGGNQGNSVSVALYPKSRVLTFRWPRDEDHLVARV